MLTISDLLKNDFYNRRDPKIQTGQSLIDDVRQYGNINQPLTTLPNNQIN